VWQHKTRVENRLAIFGWEKSAMSLRYLIPGKPQVARCITEAVKSLWFSPTFSDIKTECERIILKPEI
jgi:hypothetical protein